MTKLCLRAATLLALAFMLAAPASAAQRPPPSCGGVGQPIGVGGCNAGFCQAPTGVCNIIVQNTGSCTLVPQTCVNLNKPVCGCDFKTYKNDCARRQARVSKVKEGVC